MQVKSIDLNIFSRRFRQVLLYSNLDKGSNFNTTVNYIYQIIVIYITWRTLLNTL